MLPSVTLIATDGYLAYLPSKPHRFVTDMDEVRSELGRQAVIGTNSSGTLNIEAFMSAQSSANSWWVRVNDITSISAMGLWPEAVVEWELPRSPEGEQMFDSRMLQVPNMSSRHGRKRALSQGAMVEGLFAHAASELWSCKLKTGWVGREDHQWETVKSMPRSAMANKGGAYRSGGGPVLEQTRYVRDSKLARMQDWLSSGPELPFETMAQEVVLTDEELYARFYDGRIARLPRASLLHHEVRGDFAAYLFGRRTWLLIRRNGSEIFAELAQR